jgi:hypothetical protein
MARPSAVMSVFLFLFPPDHFPTGNAISHYVLSNSPACLRMIKTTSWGKPDVYFRNLLMKNLALVLCVIL